MSARPQYTFLAADPGDPYKQEMSWINGLCDSHLLWLYAYFLL
jgi:hypothetical protein